MYDVIYYMNKNKIFPYQSDLIKVNEIIEPNPIDSNAFRLTQEFNQKLFNLTRTSLDITPFSIITDDIKNYKTLTDIQLTQIESLSDIEKMEIIKIYNNIMSTLKFLTND